MKNLSQLKINLQRLIPPRSLSIADKWLFGKAVFLALFIRMCLKIMSFKATMGFLRRFEGKRLDIGVNNEDNELKRYHSLIIMSYFFYPIINCLSISISFWLLLRRKGITTDLKFGMLKEQDKLRAHAWLEYKGFPLTEKGKTKEKYKAFTKSVL